MENVNLDQSTKSVIGTFKGFLEIEEHQKIGNSILDLASKNSISKLIVDTSNLSVIKQETQKWIESNWFPRAGQLGIRHMAFIIPTNALGKMSTKSVNQKAGPIEIQYVDSISAAKSWISEK